MNDWLANHLKWAAGEYDFSFSEMVRLALCVQIIFIARMTHPQYKPDIKEKTFRKIVKRQAIAETIDSDEHHALISKIYFEARKAAEFLEKKAKESGKKKPG
jgi:hypothetical protein